MFIFFFILWKIKDRKNPVGWLTSITIIVLGAERFLVEFIRNTTPSFIEGLSQAQLISLVLVFVGIFKLIYIYSRHNKVNA